MLKKILRLSLLVLMPELVAFDSNLNQVLLDPYPQVYEDVDLLPYNAHGWYSHAPRFEHFIRKHQVKNVLEVGSWLGASTRHLATLIPEDGKVYAVDHWEGSEEHLQMEVRDWIPTLFQQFLSNTIHMQLTDKIVPVRMRSLEAAEKLKDLKLDIDLVYLDGSHDYESVYKDICAWYPYIEGKGIMTGDDFHDENIRRAVYRFGSEKDLTVYHDDNFWMYQSSLAF